MLIVLEAIIKCQGLEALFKKSGKRILADIISPTCAWKVGASSVQIRISSLLCFRGLLERQLVLEDTLWSCWDFFFSGLKGCMDDDWDNELRIAAINCTIPMLLYYGNNLPQKPLEELLKELMRRLDDSIDSIRISATFPIKLIIEIYKSRNDEPGEFLNKIKVFFLHLDDDNNNLQRSIFEILDVVTEWKKNDVVGIALEKKDKQRHPELIDALIKKHNLVSNE